MKEQMIFNPIPGPQTAFLECPAFEVFFGGARGGGKTTALLLDWAKHVNLYGKHAHGLLIVKEFLQVASVIHESKKVFTPLGWGWNESDKTWISKDGSRLRFDHLEEANRAIAYLGWSLSWVGVDNITRFSDPKDIMILKARLRPEKGIKPYFKATGEPAGLGFAWVKARYVDPDPKGYQPIVDPETGLDRVFIPCAFPSNPYPPSDYVERLRAATSNEVNVQAGIEGDL